ncbi:MAG: Flp pilus assembly complex ATPase component TadA [Planctomycetia bacterium]|nr:MAG: Flp pilus assembly complex ATPase component TadA [Planctomycetia bacterium]
MTISEALVDRGLVSSEQLEGALSGRSSPSERIEHVLVRSGALRERDLLKVYSDLFMVPVAELSEGDVDPDLLKLVPSRLVHRYGLIPVRRNGRGIVVAISDPLNVYALDEVRTCINIPVEPVLATRSEINKLIKAFYGVGGDVLEEMVLESDDVTVIDEQRLDSTDLDVQMAQDSSVIKLVNEILKEAIDQRASDIHFEPFEHDLAVRYRVDGVLRNANVPPEIRRFQNAVISRIKILSQLNIAEKRLPQDGSFKIKMQAREIDLRVSIIPMAFGEGMVLRILDKSSVKLLLPQLGMEGETYSSFQEMINRPHGIILVTGPTGSGKTTTLYAALAEIVSPELKILTIEDPIEYYLEGVNQVQVLPKIGLTFARALRSFLRHDPDVILVGEIRDKETAEVAINASLTGHLVFSTLHTNDAVSAATRLMDMGVEPFLISSSVEAVMAQRLVRTICKHCRESYVPEDVRALPKDFEYKPGEKLARGRGCRECHNTGYAGRRAIYELLSLNDELRELIVQRASASQLLPAARRNGLRLLRDDGWAMVRAGHTTPEEVVRATKL